MAKSIGTRTITVIRQPKVDRLSTPASGTPPEHDIEGCAIAPRSTFETDRGWVTVEGLMVAAPHGSDILSTDRVRVDGEVWEVDGAPGDYENKRGKGKATLVYLKRVGT